MTNEEFHGHLMTALHGPNASEISDSDAAALRRTIGWVAGEQEFAACVEALGGDLAGCEASVMWLVIFAPMTIDGARASVLLRLARGGRE